jgi:hypothetical protein
MKFPRAKSTEEADLEVIHGSTTLLKLDLGCGSKPQSGFSGVDINHRVAFQVDLLSFPWPWQDNSVDEVWCSHFFEHVPGKLRGLWMDELWRVLVPGRIATIICPTHDSPGAIQDFTHEWPPVCRESFMYFNRDARRIMRLDHMCKCHFEYKTRIFTDPIPQLEVVMVKIL